MLACERDEPTVYLLRWWAGEHSDSATMMSLLYPRRVDFCAELRSLRVGCGNGSMPSSVVAEAMAGPAP